MVIRGVNVSLRYEAGHANEGVQGHTRLRAVASSEGAKGQSVRVRLVQNGRSELVSLVNPGPRL